MDVLIADDDRVLCRLLEEHFKGRGFETRCAFDATQAWSQVMASPPGLLILDVKMPGGTGLEVLKRIRKFPNTSAVLVIVLTAVEDPLLIRLLYKEGPNAVLLKPVDMAMLDEEVERLVNRDPEVEFY